jgi:hypothetical protein
LVHALAYQHAVALLLVQHFVTLLVVQVAHVANISETKVVIETPLAGPVSYSLLIHSLILVDSVVFAVLVALSLSGCFLLGLSLSSLLVVGSEHMFWLAFNVFIRLRLFAPETRFSTLEVVVLALAALPSSLWELKVLFVL